MIDHVICYAIAFLFIAGATLHVIFDGDRWAFVALVAGATALLLGGCGLYVPGDQWDIDLPLAAVDGPSCGGGELEGQHLHVIVDNPTTAPTIGDDRWGCRYALPLVTCIRGDLPYRTILTVREDRLTLVAGACTYVYEEP